MLPLVAPFGYVLLTMRDDRSRQTITRCVPCTPNVRPFLLFSFVYLPLHNLKVKRECCPFAQVIGITSDPKTTFPYLLKTRASTLGLRPLLRLLRGCWFQNVDGTTRMKTPSTCSRDVRSALFTLGAPIKPA